MGSAQGGHYTALSAPTTQLERIQRCQRLDHRRGRARQGRGGPPSATGSDSGRNQYLLNHRRRQRVTDGRRSRRRGGGAARRLGRCVGRRRGGDTQTRRPESPPRPGEALAAAIRAEEEEAIEIRALKETSDVVANLSVVPAAALTLETTVTLHSATPAHELPRRAAEAIAAAAAEVATTTHMAKPPPSHPHTVPGGRRCSGGRPRRRERVGQLRPDAGTRCTDCPSSR